MFQAPAPSRPGNPAAGLSSPSGAGDAILRETLRLAQHDRASAEACLREALELLRRPPTGQASGAPNRERRLAPWQLRKATAHIEANLDQTVRVRDLAALTHLTTGYFSRAFRGSVGMSPQAYLIARRIACAERLLAETTEPLSGIAAACGFYDQSYMSRMFRRATGETPSAWRRARRAEVDPTPR